MLVTKLLFIALILICAAFYILYIWDFALVLLVIMAALPVVMFVCLFITKHRIKTAFLLKDKFTVKNVSFPIQLSVTNKTFFPIGKAEARIEYCNVCGGETSTFDIHLPIQPSNTQKLTFQLSSNYCGIVRVKCAKIYIFDPLKIFRMKVGSNVSADIAVTPEGQDVSCIITYTDRVNEESSMFSQHKAGDDPSEVFDLRDYSPGDKPNRIHWKLSSKKDELIVKDYSLPIDVPVILFLDLSFDSKNNTLELFDTIMETLLSVSRFLIENERTHTVVYYDSKTQCFEKVLITSLDMLTTTVKKLILSMSEPVKIPAPAAFLAENTGLGLSSFTLITAQLRQSDISAVENDLDADIKNALVAVGPVDKTESIADEFSAVRVFPVAAGRISASIKDIEL